MEADADNAYDQDGSVGAGLRHGNEFPIRSKGNEGSSGDALSLPEDVGKEIRVDVTDIGEDNFIVCAGGGKGAGCRVSDSEDGIEGVAVGHTIVVEEVVENPSGVVAGGAVEDDGGRVV